MKTLIGIFVTALIMTVILIIQVVKVNYLYEQEIGSNWELADRASTIALKSEYIGKYVSALEKSGAMHGHNAIFLKTPQNDLEVNLTVVRSLRDRLQEISTMDVQSFAYQQAIQQITSQEQKEAGPMTSEFEGGWRLHNGYWYLWDWILAILFVFLVIVLIGSGFAMIVILCA